jgi:anti-anti-sigma factor
MPMHVEMRGSDLLVRLSGDLTLSTEESLIDAVTPHACEHAGDVTVDIEHLDYIDSAGIGELVRFANLVADNGGTLRLSNPPPLVLKVLEKTGLTRMIPVLE